MRADDEETENYTYAIPLLNDKRSAVPALSRRGFVTGGPPALYSAMWKRVRLRAGTAAAASHLIVTKKVAKGVALARRKKTLRPFAA